MEPDEVGYVEGNVVYTLCSRGTRKHERARSPKEEAIYFMLKGESFLETWKN